VEACSDGTSPRPLLCLVRPPVSGTLESACGRPPNERPLHHHPRSRPSYRYRARHDVLPEAGFTRTAVYSTTLYVMPSHVDKTVRHAYKLPPRHIKGGAVPWPQKRGRIALARTLSAFTTILALASIKKPLGPRGPTSSPASLVAPLCKHYGATQYSALSTPLLDVRPRPEPG
jgi:hypothetical protein